MGFDWEFILGDDNDVQQGYDDLLDTTERILDKHDTYMTEMAAFMIKKCTNPNFVKEITCSNVSPKNDDADDETLPFEEV